MSEYKQIKSRIWQDNWFLSLSTEEKLLWIFLITNEYCHISGLYELPKPLVSPLTGVKNWEEILLKFAKKGKIAYENGWILIKNKQKHQPVSKNVKDNVNISIKNYFEENKEILAKLTKNSKPLTSPLQAPCNTLLELKEKVKVKEKLLSAKADLANEFDSTTYVNQTLANKQRHIHIIGLYWRCKGFLFPNKEAASKALTIELKNAKLLTDYTDEVLTGLMEWLQEQANAGKLDYEWKLSTVVKKIQGYYSETQNNEPA